MGRHSERRDEFGLPAVDLHISYGEEVPRTLKAARDRLVAILDATGYQVTLQSLASTPTPGESVHYGGSVRMHHSPCYGMLDGYNRLHAVRNVVVGDASSFTTGVEKNPLLTSMALSARAAARLAADLKSRSLA